MKLLTKAVRHRLQELCERNSATIAKDQEVRQIERRFIKLMEETGEAAQAFIKAKSPIEMIEELFDTIIVTYDIMQFMVERSNLDTGEIETMMQQKLSKFESRIK